MNDIHIPPLALALTGLVLALKPDCPTSAIAFIAAMVLFGWMKWLESKARKHDEDIEAQIKDLKTKVESLLMARGLGR